MYIITGGSGFFGQILIQHLVQHGEQVRSIDVLPPSHRIDEVEYIQADVRDGEAMKRATNQNDVVIHNAALVPLSRDTRGFWEVNVEGTRQVLEAAAAAGVHKVVFISSSSVFGIPQHSELITEETPHAPFEAYGRSKVAAEAVCEEYKTRIDISIIRPRTIIGPGRMGILSLVFDWVARHRPVMILGKGTNHYQLVSAHDLAEAVRRVCTTPCHGEHFNVGSTVYGTLREDLEEFLKRVQSRSRVYSVPGWVARVVLPPLSAVRLVPFVTYQYTMADRDIAFSMEKMKRLLGWVPMQSNADMLVEAFTWYQTHPHVDQGSVHSRPLKKGLLKLLG